MGREVRRVPENWEHPKEQMDGFDGPFLAYKALFPGERYQAAVDEWDAGRVEWEEGPRPDFTLKPKYAEMSYEEWAGQRPNIDNYMPNWPDEERTHLMMYENTSEGTPISPAFKTPEELARWLADNNASAFGNSTATYEGWLRVACRGWAPSMIIVGGVMVSGVDGLTNDGTKE
jgi:hypothetical protein